MEVSGTLVVQSHKPKTADRELPWVLNLPAPGSKASCCGVLLTHGAGGDLSSGVLPQVAADLAAAGVPVLRFTCKPVHLETRCNAMRAFLEQAQTLHSSLSKVSSWVLAGHSMGGRVAVAVAADAEDAEGYTVLGCVLSSYPLHPPAKPEQLRDEPLCSLQLPLLFLRGTSDPFSTDGPWQSIQPRMQSSDLQVHTIAGGDHGLKVKGGAAAQKAALQGANDAVVNFVQGLGGQARPAAKAQKAAPDIASASKRNNAKKKGSTKRGKPTSTTQRAAKQQKVSEGEANAASVRGGVRKRTSKAGGSGKAGAASQTTAKKAEAGAKKRLQSGGSAEAAPAAGRKGKASKSKAADAAPAGKAGVHKRTRKAAGSKKKRGAKA